MRIAAAGPARHAAPPNSWSLRDIFILFPLFRGFSEIRASDVIICQSTPLPLIYYLKARGINSTPQSRQPADRCDLYVYRTRCWLAGSV